MKANEEMRVIAVGDDDQNIYELEVPTRGISMNWPRQSTAVSSR